jgi:hypothetical protein
MAVGNYTDSSGTGVTLAEQWNGNKWTVQTTPNPSGSQFDFLNSVSCTSSTACTAVGAFDSGTFGTLAERWDGHKWSLQATPNAPGGSFLIGVACSAGTACTAVGYGYDVSGVTITLAQGWDGGQWSTQPTVNPTGDRGAQFVQVDCKSPSSCVAVGQEFGGTLAELWDGTTWRIVPTPNPAGAPQGVLNSVSCTSPSACVAVGTALDNAGHFFGEGNSLGTITERWNGTTWAIEPTPTSGMAGSFLNAVSCTSSNACTAVGSIPVGDSTGGVVAERWDGKSWSIQPTPVPATPISFFAGVSCTSASACTAVGGAFDSSFNSLGTVTEQWDGTTWTVQPSPTATSPGYFLGAVSCTSASACTAVGNTDAGMLAERWNGTVWTQQSAVTPPGTEGNGDFLSGISCSSPSACTAVGLIFTPFPPFTIAERWDGTSWSIQDTPILPGAYDIAGPAVSCPTLSVCTAVGGYANNGPNVTLAEQWNRDGGNPNGSVSSRPDATSHLGSCLLPIERASFRADRTPTLGQRHLRAPRC